MYNKFFLHWKIHNTFFLKSAKTNTNVCVTLSVGHDGEVDDGVALGAVVGAVVPNTVLRRLILLDRWIKIDRWIDRYMDRVGEKNDWKGMKKGGERHIFSPIGKSMHIFSPIDLKCTKKRLKEYEFQI